MGLIPSINEWREFSRGILRTTKARSHSPRKACGRTGAHQRPVCRGERGRPAGAAQTRAAYSESKRTGTVGKLRVVSPIHQIRGPAATSRQRLIRVATRGRRNGRTRETRLLHRKSLVDDPIILRRDPSCPVWREPAHGVVMVSGYDEAVAVQRDTEKSMSVCNIVSGPWSGIPVEPHS